MTLWNKLTVSNPHSRSPILLKALLYDCLVGFFAWMAFFCTVFTDEKHHPYGHPLMMVGVVVALLSLAIVFFLWVGTVYRGHGDILDMILLPLVILLMFLPACWTCRIVYDLAAWAFHSILGV